MKIILYLYVNLAALFAKNVQENIKIIALYVGQDDLCISLKILVLICVHKLLISEILKNRFVASAIRHVKCT